MLGNMLRSLLVVVLVFVLIVLRVDFSQATNSCYDLVIIIDSVEYGLSWTLTSKCLN